MALCFPYQIEPRSDGVGGFSFYISTIKAFGGTIAILETLWACYR
jgi:hypothetical protein